MNKVILIGVLVVLAVVAVFVFRGGDSEDLGSSPTPTPSVTVSPSASPTATTSPAASSPTASPKGTSTPMASPAAREHKVTIEGFAFSPAQLTVNKGDKITFTNKDSVEHTATSLNVGFDTGLLSKNKSGTIDTSTLAVGTYEYKCTPHPFMRGTIIVE